MLTPAAPAAMPDAELVALCSGFDGIERRIGALDAGQPGGIEDDDARGLAAECLRERQRPMLDRLCALRATTPAGFSARARTLALWSEHLARDPGPGGRWEDRMLAALLRDVAGAA